MIKYLVTLLAAVSVLAADFTDAERTQFENQCKDITTDVMQTLSEKHPNPKITKNINYQEVIANALAGVYSAGRITMISGMISDSKVRREFIVGEGETGNWDRSQVDFKWSDDGRKLVVVASYWGGDFFDLAENYTLKGHVIKVGLFSNIRLTPVKATKLETSVEKDYPAWVKDEIIVQPKRNGWFEPYTAHDGIRVINWDLYADPEEMSPPFHGWFTWHEKNQLLALKERWPGFDAPESHYQRNLRETLVEITNASDNPVPARLEVRTTRRKYVDTYDLEGQIEFDSTFYAYGNYKRWNPSSFSYRTHTWTLNDCNVSFENTDELVDWLNDNGHRGDNAQETIEKPWNMTIDLPVATDYSGTRLKVTDGNGNPIPEYRWPKWYVVQYEVHQN